MTNKKNTWGVKNEEGKVLEKFRMNQTAICAMPRLKFNRREKLKVIRLIPKKLF